MALQVILLFGSNNLLFDIEEKDYLVQTRSSFHYIFSVKKPNKYNHKYLLFD